MRLYVVGVCCVSVVVDCSFVRSFVRSGGDKQRRWVVSINNIPGCRYIMVTL